MKKNLPTTEWSIYAYKCPFIFQRWRGGRSSRCASRLEGGQSADPRRIETLGGVSGPGECRSSCYRTRRIWRTSLTSSPREAATTRATDTSWRSPRRWMMRSQGLGISGLRSTCSRYLRITGSDSAEVWELWGGYTERDLRDAIWDGRPAQ